MPIALPSYRPKISVSSSFSKPISYNCWLQKLSRLAPYSIRWGGFIDFARQSKTIYFHGNFWDQSKGANIAGLSHWYQL
jgi:hypothetical protein